MTLRTTPNRKGRTPRSFRFDPRLAIGLALVIASIAGVVALVSSADKTQLVYTAKSSLNVGDRISADDLISEGVRLGPTTDRYLMAEQMPSEGLIVTRTIAQGELVPSAAVGSDAGTRVASVVVKIASQLPQAIESGSVVDVWAAREADEGGFAEPSILVSEATVVRVIESDGIVAGADSVDVELLVPRIGIADVLESIANNDAMSLVPVNLPVKE